MVLISTQSVLSSISASSSHKLSVIKENEYDNDSDGLVTERLSLHDLSSMSRDVTRLSLGNHSEITKNDHNTSNGVTNNDNMLQTLGWMQAVVEYRVKMSNIAFEMEQNRQSNMNEIEQQAQVGNFTMDISPLYDLVSEMVRSI